MRRYASICAAILATLVAVLAAAVFSIFQQGSPAERPSAKGITPDLRHREVTISSGSRSQRIPVKFEVRNSGPRTVQILSVQSSCNCVGAEIDTRELLAGCTSHLTLNVSLTSFERTKQVSCVLVTDDSQEPHKRFSAKVTVMQPVQFDDESFDFGQLRLNDSVRKELVLTLCAKGNAAPKLNDVAGNTPALIAVPDYSRLSSSTINDLVIHRLPIVVTFQPDESTLGVPLTVRASTIVDGIAVSAELPLRWRPKRQFAVSPPRAMLTLGESESTPKSVSINLKRKDSRPFGIKGVVSNSKMISAAVAPQTDDREAAIEVRWSGESALPERLVSTVVVTTDNSLEPRLIIPVVFVRPDVDIK